MTLSTLAAQVEALLASRNFPSDAPVVAWLTADAYHLDSHVVLNLRPGFKDGRKVALLTIGGKFPAHSNPITPTP